MTTRRMAKRLRPFGVLVAAVFTIAASCTPGSEGQTDNGLPAAQTPVYLSVAVPHLDDSGNKGWTGVGTWPGKPDTYVVLPLTLAPLVRIYFSAPYPSKFHMTATIGIAEPDTTAGFGAVHDQTVDLPEYVGDQQDPTAGYFQLLDVDPQANPPRWHYQIRLPDSVLAANSIAIAISDLSENPAYTGPQQESGPLAFTLDDGGTDVRVVVDIRLDTGEGMVTSDPPGIDCRPTCKFRFRGWTTVTLKVKRREDYTFSGWSGACSGSTTGSCTLTLDGAGKWVTATFGSFLGPECSVHDPYCTEGTQPFPQPNP
ncbi:MAG TPA: hypothetical protein VHA10_20185 [Hypericibacter adhaerens]|uniref:InlB B-repeat-containing protein n=1 Tax=Hypericibacter adhaerens TaxID=2602016 RepID=UPI002CD267F4|nr:hypothetical protein [Hypericibacter adhaerens]HWA45548.1 hypothetical protein [Hypericibacter adhaerens]